MNFDDIKKFWVEDTSIPTDPAPTLQDWVDQTAARGRKLHRRVWIRDFLECTTAVALALFFGVTAFTVYPRMTGGAIGWPFLTAAAGCLVVLAGFAASRVRAARIHRHMDDGGVLGGLLAQREDLRLQAMLLRKVAWWYLLPLWPGVAWICIDIALRVAASSPERTFLGAMAGPPGYTLLAFLGISVFVFWFNRKVARAHLEPQLRDINALIAQWQDDRTDDPGPPDAGERHRGN